MTIWRMSFRCGDRGYEMWPHCFELGVAAITYSPLAEVDLSKYPPFEPRHLWGQLAPAQHASLRRVAYEMKKGDVIYVKQGPKIVGRGTVKGSYQFNLELGLTCPAPDNIPWAHIVPVEWDSVFEPIDILLGAEPLTVLPLSGKRLRRLKAAINRSQKYIEQQEALEGEIYRAETTFRKRNRALIAAKKANSDGRCDICGFSFKERYGSLNRDCLIAHHIHPIGQRQGSSKTNLDDIALLCPNCHAAIHTQDPPISLENLRKRLR